jgi:hypothetical protein
METGLTVKEHDIAIDNMSLNNVTVLETVCDCPSVAKLEVLFKPVASSSDIVGTGVPITPISHSCTESVYVEASHALGIRQNLCNTLRDGNLVYAKIRIRRYDSASREVDTLPREIATKTSLLSFQALTESSYWFLTHLGGYTGQLGIDVHGN